MIKKRDFLLSGKIVKFKIDEPESFLKITNMKNFKAKEVPVGSFYRPISKIVKSFDT